MQTQSIPSSQTSTVRSVRTPTPQATQAPGVCAGSMDAACLLQCYVFYSFYLKRKLQFSWEIQMDLQLGEAAHTDAYS